MPKFFKILRKIFAKNYYKVEIFPRQNLQRIIYSQIDYAIKFCIRCKYSRVDTRLLFMKKINNSSPKQ